MAEQKTDGGRGAGSIVALVIGSIVGLVALALLAGGGGVLWADQTQRDSAGFFTSSAHTYASPTYAISHDGVDITDIPGSFDRGKLATVRIRATGADKPVFVGIARESAVDSYLGNVAHANATDLNV